MKNKIKILIAAVIGALIGSAFMWFFLSSETIPISDREYFSLVHNELQDANKIRIIMFEMVYYSEYPESHASLLLEDLVNAKERGADVKVILEGGEEYLKGFTNSYACNYLKENGIDVRYDEEGVTTHAKLVIADNFVIIGSTNWNFYALDKNNEVGILVKSNYVANYFESYFNELWTESSPC